MPSTPYTAIEEMIAALSARARRAAIITDFDGTIAPIVEDPPKARPLAGAGDVLAALARRYRRVAVVSGRPVIFLLEHLGGDIPLAPAAGSRRGPLPSGPGGPLFFGLYGMERVGPDGVMHMDSAAEPWRSALDEVDAAARLEAPEGVLVEHKGLGVTLHWRARPQHETWVAAFARRQAAQRSLELHSGKMSIELRPPTSTDKGTVVEELCAGLEAACFVGDDIGDLPAFSALDRHRARGAMTFKVAVASTESPLALTREADIVVDGPEGVLELLRLLAFAHA